MSLCGEPCDGCANRAEHHLCDACCHEEPDAIQKENRELHEKLEWQAACTKALMESQERLAAELKEAKEWAKHRDEFAAAETGHANRWADRAHKAEAEVERLQRSCERLTLLHKVALDRNDEAMKLCQEAVTQRDYFREKNRLAFQRGAEAMREAAASCVGSDTALLQTYRSVLEGRICALPVPGDKK